MWRIFGFGASSYKQLNRIIKTVYSHASIHCAMGMDETVFGLVQMQTNVALVRLCKMNNYSSRVSNQKVPRIVRTENIGKDHRGFSAVGI